MLTTLFPEVHSQLPLTALLGLAACGEQDGKQALPFMKEGAGAKGRQEASQQLFKQWDRPLCQRLQDSWWEEMLGGFWVPACRSR